MRQRRRWYTRLWAWVVVAIIAGVVFGLVAPEQAEGAEWLAEAFIQVIEAVTGPVIFVTVVVGIASLGNAAATMAIAKSQGGRDGEGRFAGAGAGREAPDLVLPGRG